MKNLLVLFLIAVGLISLVADDITKISTDHGEGLTRRVFTVQSDFFPIKPNMLLDEKTHSYDVTKPLKDKGVVFASGTSATYQPTLKQLTLVNTAEQVELVEELVNATSGAGLRILPGTKFVEINQGSPTK